MCARVQAAPDVAAARMWWGLLAVDAGPQHLLSNAICQRRRHQDPGVTAERMNPGHNLLGAGPLKLQGEPSPGHGGELLRGVPSASGQILPQRFWNNEDCPMLEFRPYDEALLLPSGSTPPTPLDSCFRRNDEKRLPRPASYLGVGWRPMGNY